MKLENRLNEILLDILNNENGTLEILSIVDTINSTDNSLTHLTYYENDEDFFNTYYYNNPYEVARAINYGCYSFTDRFVCINSYGNIESYNTLAVKLEIKNSIADIADRMIELMDKNEDIKEKVEKLI